MIKKNDNCFAKGEGTAEKTSWLSTTSVTPFQLVLPATKQLSSSHAQLCSMSFHPPFFGPKSLS